MTCLLALPSFLRTGEDRWLAHHQRPQLAAAGSVLERKSAVLPFLLPFVVNDGWAIGLGILGRMLDWRIREVFLNILKGKGE
jgi:hypothetical protein